MISKERWEYSKNVGFKTEKMFEDACAKLGYECIKTEAEDDIYGHIDFYVNRVEKSKTSVDVKGGNHPECIWVEFKNVNGDNGWLFGNAEYIAFDMPEENGFIIVSRTQLIDLCENIVEKVFVDKKNATRKLYQRAGRKDVITRLNLQDLKKIPFKLINY